VGVYDGSGQVIEAISGPYNAIRIVTLNEYKTLTPKFWGTASANIPSGISTPGCYQVYCWSSKDFQQFDMRLAIARAARATSMIGSSYTTTALWKPPQWGNANSAPVRATFRCDTFVLWSLSAPPYLIPSTARSKWKSYIQNWANSGAKTPTLVFNGVRSYQ
jgi:hypothetical protein